MAEATERIHFTVSMWNRVDHLRVLLDNLAKVAKVDSNISLHVCAFEGEDASFADLRALVASAPCDATFTYRTDGFGNGLGHNIVLGGLPHNSIACAITVDICLPVNITRRVRRNVVQGKAVYLPRMLQECRNGQLRGNDIGSAMMGLYKSDMLRIGGFHPPRAPWCGGKKSAGAEDLHFERKAQKLGLKINRPKATNDLFCHWHKRARDNPFYYAQVRGTRPGRLLPWVNMYDNDGKEITEGVL